MGPGTDSGRGIYQSASFRNLTARNGKLVNWKGYAGFHAAGASTILSDLQVSSNYFGIMSGPNSTVSGCTAYSNDSSGILVGDGSLVNNCAASHNFNGIHASNASSVSGCVTHYNQGAGIYLSGECRVTACISNHNGFNSADGAGIYTSGANSIIDGNTVIGNLHGIKVDTSGNFIVRNSASDNTTNYLIGANNKVGSIVNAPNSGSISGSSGGAGVGSTNPWANFSF